MGGTMFRDESPSDGHREAGFSPEGARDARVGRYEEARRAGSSPGNGPRSSGTLGHSHGTRKRMGDVQLSASPSSPAQDRTAEDAVDVDSEKTEDEDPHKLRGFRNAFSSQSSLQHKHPHVYRRSGWEYVPREGAAAVPSVYRHRDSRQRVHQTSANDDRYLSPYDGRLKRLIVQAVDNVYRQREQNVTWDRTYVSNVTPWHLQLAYWPKSHLELGTERPTPAQKALVVLKWIPASMLLFVAISFPGNAEGEIRNSGRFDPFPYRYSGYAKVARNVHEEYQAAGSRLDSAVSGQSSYLDERPMLPNTLCFLKEPHEQGMHGVDERTVDEWLAIPGNSQRNLDYVFVAYTVEHFPRPDRPGLREIAEKAARDLNCVGYWVDYLGHNEVYRINDIIRGAKRLVVAVADPTPTTHQGREPHIDVLLQQWGGRLWTFPEVLLAPRGREIPVYRRGAAQNPVLTPTKHDFARRAWVDVKTSRALVDHFEGSIVLSPLERVKLVMQCLHARKTKPWLAGDHSYALMGLLTNRPRVDETDSAFQAFARLSMANDSGMLLERMLCLAPPTEQHEWWSLEDVWSVNLWDIYPNCQVSGIGHDDTVLLDGARAAAVRWKSFARVATIRRDRWKRTLTKVALHSSTLVLLLGAFFFGHSFYLEDRQEDLANSISFALTNITAVDAALTAELNELGDTLVYGIVGMIISPTALFSLGIICFAYGIFMHLLAPSLLLRTYGDRLWKQQPWLFGFEGYLPLHTLERQLFGTRGRLAWSASGSPLSRHARNEWGECRPADPMTDPATRERVARARTAGPGRPHVFTLVDTHSMTVTLFEAVRPPVAVLLLGAEGGRQRAVGCSYDWTSETLYPEAVLRMDNSARDLMDTVPRVRLGLKRPSAPTRRVEPKAGRVPPKSK